MSQVYKICSGNDTINTTVTMSKSSLKSRQYTIGDTIYSETYYILTFSCTQPPVENNLRVFYEYEYRYRNNYDVFSAWQTQFAFAAIPIGQNSVTKNVPVEVNTCFGSGDDGYQDFTAAQ